MNFKTNLKTSFNLIDMTPLVDVVFLMLIFFIITSDVLPLKSLNIENPVIDRDALPMTTQVLVVMDAQNVIYVGSKKTIVDLASLKTHINHEIEKVKHTHPSIEPTVVLSVDRRVEYGVFLKMFALAQECSSKIRFVYRPEESNAEYL